MAFNKAKAVQRAQRYAAQGKTALAIKQYLSVLENDPSDLVLLNTAGDLYIRENNLTEGLECFGKLAEAYAQEGFIIKVVAICKKISKIDPNNAGPFLRMAELYLAKGLTRQAREAYTRAFEIYERAKQKHKALEVLRKLSRAAPNHPASLLKLAQYAGSLGNTREAAEAYLKAAQHGDNSPAAKNAWRKAAELAPDDPAV